jgi:hypothetical protein
MLVAAALLMVTYEIYKNYRKRDVKITQIENPENFEYMLLNDDRGDNFNVRDI